MTKDALILIGVAAMGVLFLYVLVALLLWNGMSALFIIPIVAYIGWSYYRTVIKEKK